MFLFYERRGARRGRDTSLMPSVVSLIRSPSLATAPYAFAATAPANARLIFLAGACPLDESGATVGEGDVAAQARQVMANAITALADSGASVSDVIYSRLSVATTSRDDLTVAWNIGRAAFGDHDVPSTLVGVTVLGDPYQLVELELVAAIVD